MENRMANSIELLITDLDGTLVSTLEANYLAYKRAFEEVGLSLSLDKYKECFGYRFDEFMAHQGVSDTQIKLEISNRKTMYYSDYFNRVQLNLPLLEFLKAFKLGGGKIAMATTAKRANVEQIIKYFSLEGLFDKIVTGEDVLNGKPSPEVYNFVLKELEIAPERSLVFEDSKIGAEAAAAAQISYVMVSPKFYGA